MPMLRNSGSIACLLFASMVGLAAPGRSQELTDERYDELLEVLQPDKDAPWRSIPWQIDLLESQRQAVAGAKPIFIWAMDGHPLGCT